MSDERFSRDASRRISLTRVSKLLRLVLISTDLSISRGPICQRRLSPTPKSFAHVRSLVERKTNHAFALPLFPTLLDQERKRSRAIILDRSRVEPSRVEPGSFAHLQTDWANGVKITGARRSLLTCLVRWAGP